MGGSVVVVVVVVVACRRPDIKRLNAASQRESASYLLIKDITLLYSLSLSLSYRLLE